MGIPTKVSKGEFLSTPSARRATYRINKELLGTTISIHALREEGDTGGAGRKPSKNISIHALREEGDDIQTRKSSRHDNFYPRPPRGGRRWQNSTSKRGSLNFYPRPPRGGRL